MPFAPELRSHSQKVCSLYKKACRIIEAYYVARYHHSRPKTTLEIVSYSVRYQQVLLRARFDKHKCESDPKEQRRLLWLGEHEAFLKQPHLMPMKFPYSYGLAGGVAPERVVTPPDWVMDYWHPLEKAQYPEYFKKREQRKCEFIKLWNDGCIC